MRSPPPTSAALLLGALLLAASPAGAVAPEPADVRSGLEALRVDTAAAVTDPKLQGKLVRAVDKALARLDKAVAKGRARAFKRPRKAVRAYLKKLGWKEKRGLLEPKKRPALEPATGDPLRDSAAALLALLDALVAGADEVPASGVVGPDGGALVSVDGKLTLAFSPGALAERSANVTIRALDPAALGPEWGGVAVEAAYELGPDRLAFDPPVQLALDLDEPGDSPRHGASGRLPLLIVASRGRLEVPDQGLLIGAEAGARQLLGELAHFSTVGASAVVTEGLTVSVDGLPDPPIKPVGEGFTVESGYAATADSQVAADSIVYMDRSTMPPLEADTPVPFGTEVEPGVASSATRTIDYQCAEGGMAEYRAGMNFARFELSLLQGEAQREVIYSHTFRYRIYCQPAGVQTGSTQGESQAGDDVRFHVVEPEIVKRVGEGFSIWLTEDVRQLSDVAQILILITDLRDDDDIISEPALESSVGPNDAELRARRRLAQGEFFLVGFPNHPAEEVLDVPATGPLSLGESVHRLEFTCLKAGNTLLTYDLKLIDDTIFVLPDEVRVSLSLSTLVRCVQQVGALPVPVPDTEPNDTLETAQALDLGAEGFALVEGSLGAGDAADWFAFDVAQPAGVSVAQQLSYDPVEADIRITDALGGDVGCEVDGRVVANLDPGTYFVGVTPSPGGSAGQYGLEATAGALVPLARGSGAPACEPPPALCAQNGAPCGSQGGGICVRGLCMVEVPMNVGASGNSVCAAEGLACTGVPALSFPEGEACLAFHPTARETFGPSGWKQSVYCNGAVGPACNGQANTCWDCPFCLADQLDCTTGASFQLDALFASCE